MRERHFVSTVAVVCGLVSLSEPGAMASLTDAQAQAQTVEDVRNVGDAMFNWLIDQVGFAPSVPSASMEATINFNFYEAISHSELEGLLVPQYIQSVPELDGWGYHYDYRLNSADPLGQHVMAIRSPGRDGAVTGPFYTPGSFAPEQVDEDIVWVDGAFVRWPSIPLSDRQAQARTVVDVRNVGTAMFSWLIDQVGLAPPGPPRVSEALTVDFLLYPEISHSDLESLLVPQYIQSVPELDGWGHPYDYRLNTANPLAQQVMAIRSPGRDGAFSGNSYAVGSFDPDHFDEDIAWADGFFVRWPEEIAGLSFYTVLPCRAFDTRLTSALQSGVAGSFHFGGVCGIPMSAKAVTVNVTVLGPTGAGHVILFPGGLSVPTTSTINFAAGQVRANNAILPLGGAIGTVGAWASVVNGGQVHVTLDVSGYFE
ncbi:MAG TPA: hypothetical protein VN493_05125 [Thermoanaerobaculia bacterium]|nr:hypothetical protein [Thermoanaerobaculia bacterium]